jgi:hypothetical protein
MMPLTPISASSSSLERRRWAWCWRETQVTGSAQVDLDDVVPRYQGFTLGEFVYRPGGPLATRGYRRVIAPPRMQNAGDYLTDVGFRPEGDAMVRELA